MTEQLSSPMQYTFRGDNVSFSTLAQLRDWLTTESQAWEKIVSPTHDLLKQPPFSKLRDASNRLRTARESATNAATATEPNEAQQHRQALAAALTQLSKDLYLPSSRTDLIEASKIDDDRLRIATTYFLCGGQLRGDWQQSSPVDLVIRGMIVAELIRQGRLTLEESTRESYSVLRADMLALISESRRESETYISELREAREAWKSSLVELRGEAQQNHTSMLQAHEQKLSAIEVTYREKINIDAPVKYWEKKGRGHLYFAIAAALFFGGVLKIGAEAFEASIVTLEHILETFPEPTVPALVMIGLPAFVLIWIMRILIRIVMQNLSQFDDAKERQAMIKTFLGLLVEEKKVTPEDRLLVLQAIFRPGPSGVSESDYTPPNWFDILITRIKENK